MGHLVSQQEGDWFLLCDCANRTWSNWAITGPLTENNSGFRIRVGGEEEQKFSRATRERTLHCAQGRLRYLEYRR